MQPAILPTPSSAAPATAAPSIAPSRRPSPAAAAARLLGLLRAGGRAEFRQELERVPSPAVYPASGGEAERWELLDGIAERLRENLDTARPAEAGSDEFLLRLLEHLANGRCPESAAVAGRA
jgi:hypothetical protein